MSAAGSSWYVITCLSFGSGYFSKTFFVKALSEKSEVSVREVGTAVE